MRVIVDRIARVLLGAYIKSADSGVVCSRSECITEIPVAMLNSEKRLQFICPSRRATVDGYI